MKKILLVLLIICLLFAFTACDKDSGEDIDEGEKITDQNEVDILAAAFYVLDDPTNVSIFEVEKVTIPEKNVSVERVYQNPDDKGYAILVKSKGYEDEEIQVMVGVKLGKVTYVTVVGMDYTLENNQKVLNIISQYSGKTKLDDVDDFKKNKNKISSISGATITSNSVYQAVYCALEQAKLLG